MLCKRNGARWAGIIVGLMAAALTLPGGVFAQSTSVTYRAEQAEAGKALYGKVCAQCHGANLDDGEFAPPVRGSAFLSRWSGKPASALFDELRTKMPPAAPGSLDEQQYIDLLAYILNKNAVSPGTRPLPARMAELATLILPSSQQFPYFGGVAAGVKMPPNPDARVNPLDRLTPVTEKMLNAPPEGDWLSWRRTVDAMGFSPLGKINKSNVGRLQLAWSWALPNGPNEVTPLVHDGVIFVHGFGDVVEALDAVTGDLLWHYAYRLPKGVMASPTKAISLLGTRLYVPTSDGHVIALEAKTGSVVWDVDVMKSDAYSLMGGGPLIAKGKVIVGTKGRAPGGNFIVALDAATGKEAWRFATIARPTDGNADGKTWNDVPVEKRSGGSVWTPGSYDPDLNLVFFGPGQTYDTGPLRMPKPGTSNDALYTDSTLALDPDTGKLVWHYQHMQNDQWDLDWAFERQIVQLHSDGRLKKMVVTAGKSAIFDVLDAASGKYAFSKDVGLQNMIVGIDPVTGRKKIDPALIPGDGKTKFVCPHTGGGKNWLPASINPNTHILYVPLVEACMDLEPVASGETGLLTTNVRPSIRPRPDSDGRYGRLEAINLETRESLWVVRERAPRVAGVLATAGGLIFSGDIGRALAAYDDATGKKLWSTRLNDIPNSNPISYAVDGAQYIAITVGNGGVQPLLYNQLVPEIRNPINRTATIWVFKVSEK